MQSVVITKNLLRERNEMCGRNFKSDNLTMHLNT